MPGPPQDRQCTARHIKENYPQVEVHLSTQNSTSNYKAVEYFRMINPIEHSRTKDAARKYKVEPYVIAADVYGAKNMAGRGGWTWYTGAAAWMYRFGIEYLLGFKKREDKIALEPLMKDGWEEFEIEYKYKNTVYKVKVMNNIKTGTSRMIVDGVLKEGNSFELVDDGGIHFVEYMA